MLLTCENVVDLLVCIPVYRRKQGLIHNPFVRFGGSFAGRLSVFVGSLQVPFILVSWPIWVMSQGACAVLT